MRGDLRVWVKKRERIKMYKLPIMKIVHREIRYGMGNIVKYIVITAYDVRY